MAAFDNATQTFDTNEWTYQDSDDMTTHIVTNAQTLVWDLTAASTGANYKLTAGKALSCTDGTKLTVDGDPAFTWFHVPTDATKELKAGAIRIIEDDGSVSDFEVDVTIDDVDEPTSITLLATAKDGTPRSFTWTAITMAQ